MAQKSMFWSGTATGDAGPYSAVDFTTFINYLLAQKSGVMTGLAVTASAPAAASVSVETGAAFVQGKHYINDAALTLTIDANTSGSPRIDSVVLEADWTAQTVRAAVVKGTPAGSPVPPTLTQTAGTLWQEALAQVAVANGFSTITSGNITDWRQIIVPGAYSGELRPCALSTAPAGWLLCYGQAVSRTQYAALYAALGTTYGVGDGSTTFNLPDLRGRVWGGKDNMGGSSANRVTDSSADSLGGTMGTETHQITQAELPNVNFKLYTRSGSGSETIIQMASTAGATVQQIGSASYPSYAASGGSDTAHNNMQPTMFGNWIIKT